jgi:hypothetical protein
LGVCLHDVSNLKLAASMEAQHYYIYQACKMQIIKTSKDGKYQK